MGVVIRDVHQQASVHVHVHVYQIHVHVYDYKQIHVYITVHACTLFIVSLYIATIKSH